MAHLPVGRGAEQADGCGDSRAVHEPQVDGTIDVTPQDVGLAVTVEVGQMADGPAGAVEDGGAAGHGGAVHEPEVNQAVGVAENQITLVVEIEVVDGGVRGGTSNKCTSEACAKSNCADTCGVLCWRTKKQWQDHDDTFAIGVYNQ